MTKLEMDEFILSKDLINGYSGGKITSSDFLAVGEGWFPLIKRLIEDLINLGWNKEIVDIKEKFGTIRFYINEGNDKIFNRIIDAEVESSKVCEISGKPGELRRVNGWYKTLCEEEYNKLLR